MMWQCNADAMIETCSDTCCRASDTGLDAATSLKAAWTHKHGDPDDNMEMTRGVAYRWYTSNYVKNCEMDGLTRQLMD